MTDFFFLVLISLLLGAAGLGVFFWSLRNGQYDDLDGAAQRVLFEDDDATNNGAPPANRQARAGTQPPR